MPKQNQQVTPKPKLPGLWERITFALKTGSTTEIAAKLGISGASVSEWKNQGSLPRIEHLIEIARLGNTSLDWLLTGKRKVDPKWVEAWELEDDFMSWIDPDIRTVIQNLARSKGEKDHETSSFDVVNELLSKALTQMHLSEYDSYNGLASSIFRQNEREIIRDMAKESDKDFDEVVREMVLGVLITRGRIPLSKVVENEGIRKRGHKRGK